jgi:hypothetical protein
MIPLQMGLGSLVGAVVFGLVPLVVLLIVIYRLAQIAENTDRIADALEVMARRQRSSEAASALTSESRQQSPPDEEE